MTFSPWINCLLVLLQKKNWRGKHRLYLLLSKYFAKKVIIHRIDNRHFSVPVGEWCFWLEKGPENYYLDEFVPFCDVLNNLNSPFTLFDLGADIGTVSSLVAAHCPNLRNVVAFEPNPKSFEVLTLNLDNLNQPTQCVNSAVSDFDGFANFYADTNRLNDHEGCIDNSGLGDTVVTTLDSWHVKHQQLFKKNTIVLKIDVEGQEIQAICGANGLIKYAEKVVILIEIHPQVLSKTNNSPEDLFVAAEKCRAFDWTVPLYQNIPINRSLSFFEQVPVGQYDILGISR